MIEHPKISIILPVYNGEKFVQNTINSILHQKFTDYELIIVDDGSTDNSEKIIKKFNDPRIKLIKQINQGICSARNSGIKNSTAEYLMFCDHDDEYLPEYLQDVSNEIGRKEADIIKFGCIEKYIQENNVFKEHKVELPLDEYKNKDCRKLLYLYANENEYIWDGVYKKDLIERCGGFDTSYKAGCEDIDLLIKIVTNANSIRTINKIEYIHYIRDSFSTSRKYSDNSYRDVLRTYRMRMDTVCSDDNEYMKFVYYKNKALVWALLGMFSFKTCTLSRKEIIQKFKETERIIVRSNYVEKKCDKKALMFYLIIKKQYGILASICLAKRRMR